jgi:hypothetical protein
MSITAAITTMAITWTTARKCVMLGVLPTTEEP